MAPNSQQQNRGKKKEEDSDAFMRLVSNLRQYLRRILILAARQGDRRMHQRYWCSFYSRRSTETESPPNTNDLRMVRRAAHERDSRDR